MRRGRLQFSLRQLLTVMTVVATIVMVSTHYFRIVIGFIVAAGWIADIFSPILFPMLDAAWDSWLNPRGWRPHEPTEREKREFAARYPRPTSRPGE